MKIDPDALAALRDLALRGADDQAEMLATESGYTAADVAAIEHGTAAAFALLDALHAVATGGAR